MLEILYVPAFVLKVSTVFVVTALARSKECWMNGPVLEPKMRGTLFSLDVLLHADLERQLLPNYLGQ